MPRLSIRSLKKMYVTLIVGAVSGLVSIGVHAADESKQLLVGGTGSALCTMQKLADGFEKANPEIQVKVLQSLGSGGGIKALMAGRLTVSVSSRPLTESEILNGLLSQEIARTPFVFAVHSKTPASNMTLGQVAAMYAGKTKTWSDGTTVRPVLRPISDIDTDTVRKMSAELDQAIQSAHQREGKNIAITDTDAADELERIPGSIGTSALALIACEERRVKVLKVNGIEPNKLNLVNIQYPHMKSIYLIVNKNAPSIAQKFVKYINSTAGSKIIMSNGNLASASSK
ncbi:PstS family phosphate ABC transporter substrate-binding protein [Massilia sp. H6]|uniref:PstS family phosphate ABC transporter substrate-binding protein n=1 Tax=Massilia sp. H6 TaxID=2970464 RepID=UPI002167E43F|nr:substrate-binding domain-containing protein [Massilia sp. H6]UVW29280.1 substrate-binding domain-containing protein [Massilia sp. H6]